MIGDSTKPGIAILTTYYRPVVGGVETAAESLATWLGAHGRVVHVLTTRTTRTAPGHERTGSVEVHRWPYLGRRRAWNKWLAVLPLAWAAWRLRHQVGLYFVVDFRATGLAARLAGWLAGRPVIFQAETDGAFEVGALRRTVSRLPLVGRWLASVATWPIRRLYRGADLNIGISKTIVQEAVGAGWPADRVAYPPHPVDRTLFAPASRAERRALRQRLVLPLAAVLVVFVGRLSREKGIVDLAHAWRGLRVDGAHLVVVGPDMEGHPWNAGPEVRRLLANAPPATCVGGVSASQVAEYLRASDIVVLPSHFEAFGIAAAEGMSCGLPAVATDVGGFRDYVRHGHNGLLVPPQNPEALRRALSELIADENRRLAMGQAAHRDTAPFDRDVVFAQCEAWIDGLTQ